MEEKEFETCEDCGELHEANFGFMAEFEEAVEQLTQKPTFMERVRRFIFRHKNAKFLLTEQEIAILAATAAGGEPGDLSATQQLVRALAEKCDEVEYLTMTLRFGAMVSQMTTTTMIRLQNELVERNTVIEKALADLDRVRSESKIIRTIKADLKAVLPANDDDDKGVETEAA